MAYQHDTFPFSMEQHPSASMYFRHPVQFPSYLQPQHPPDMMYQPFPLQDYGDFMHPGMLMDDFDDSAEISTRPRLTKDQVEILESQFQAHPKPNSMVKKQLAMQTKLTLPRVANWFQNRRAKAKQQKKQEEYEIQQHMDSRGGGMSDSTSRESTAETAEPTSRCASSPLKLSSSIGPSVSYSSPSRSASPVRVENAKETTWLSLQRALGATKAIRREQQQDQTQVSMPRPETLTTSIVARIEPPFQLPAADAPAEWVHGQPVAGVWPCSSPGPETVAFDFGFDREQQQVANEQFVVPPNGWTQSYVGNSSMPHNEYSGMISPPSTTTPVHAMSSRRGSGSDELAVNLGTFALAASPAVPALLARQESPSENGIDLASRRKRPRPAALTSASLRSRSYGALSSTSPSFRNGPPSGGQLRQVKSTGHSLNSHYAGVRKASIAQKSPLNISSFAEAEALDSLMAQQIAESAASKTPTPGNRGLTGVPHELLNMGYSKLSQLPTPSEIVSQYKQLQSPPVTPFQAEFMIQSAMGMQQPVPPAQYATFADFTPPYSAGPLTNSTCSWSDAPLQSPELPHLGQGSYMSAMGYNQHDTALQPWVLLSDNMPDSGSQNKTEFFITEFPGQKEEHATVAQHVQQPRPKNYVFANTAARDYDA